MMYDSHPEFDVPQQNIIQRFFGQRWSAIVIEICMTVVISVAASRAFDLFGPFNSTRDASADSSAQSKVVSEEAQRGPDIPLERIERYAVHYFYKGWYSTAAVMHDWLISAEPTEARHYYNRGLNNFFRQAYAEGYHDFLTAIRLGKDCESLECHYEHASGRQKVRHVLQFC